MERYIRGMGTLREAEAFGQLPESEGGSLRPVRRG